MDKEEQIKELEQKRKENFEKLGQWLLQKKYYEENIVELLELQAKLCSKILKLKGKYVESEEENGIYD